MKWTNKEIRWLKTLEKRATRLPLLYLEMKRDGFKKTYKALEHKYFRMVINGELEPKIVMPQKMAYLDIETTHLKANFGIMLSWALKGRDESKVIHDMITKKELFNHKFDKRVVSSLLKAMEGYDVFVVYYGTRFDMPFIRTKALEHGLKFPSYSEKRMFDLYYVARNKLCLHSNRLGVVCDFLDIPGKTPLKPLVWKKAAYGDAQSLRYILDHNIADVEILESAHKRLEDFTKGVVKSV
jgi:uncharacterized protein YprB with RNaseH-like and TPR domain